MSRIFPMFSSSRGNSTYLSGGGTALLIDAGVSLRQLTQALAVHGIRPEHLSGVLITHEHTDHIKGLQMLLKKHAIPLYASRGTLEHLCSHGLLPGSARITELSETICIDGIQVTPFDTPHDACHSVGFRFTLPDQRTVGYATDLGHITETVREHITGCDLVVLESNYDRRMLECSSYPWSLKRRIKSDYGHLSNADCAGECVRLVEHGTTRIVLAHLSEQNNQPCVARQETEGALALASMREHSDYLLAVAPPRGATALITF